MATAISRNFTLPRVSIAALVVIGMTSAFAADWPSFKPGTWQFDRTLEGAGRAPEKVSQTKCVDPAADQKKMRDALARVGCTFTPVTRSGTTYRHSATCRMAGTTTTSESVLEVHGVDSYTVTVDSVTGDSRTHEVLTARRVGDCAK